MTDQDAREALGIRVHDRRLAMGLSIDEAAARADQMSPTTWSRVEAGKTVRPLTYTAVDKALRWVTGACRRFLVDGTEPQENPALDLPARETGIRTNRQKIEGAHLELDRIEEELDRRLREARRDPDQLIQTVEALRKIQSDDQKEG